MVWRAKVLSHILLLYTVHVWEEWTTKYSIFSEHQIIQQNTMMFLKLVHLNPFINFQIPEFQKVLQIMQYALPRSAAILNGHPSCDFGYLS